MASDQQTSDAFWIDCHNSYLAAPEFYERQEVALRSILQKIGRGSKLLDVGCGDGRYTCLGYEFVESAIGIDLSATLVDQARERAGFPACLQETLKFEKGDIESHPVREKFDRVFCLGLTSALIAETKFLSVTRKIRNVLTDDGFLILKDTLSKNAARINRVGGYVAIYRSRFEYIKYFESLTLDLLEAIELLTTEEYVNEIFLFQVRKN